MNTTRSNPWLILILALIGGMIWISTVDMNAQSGGMPAVIPNPGVPIDSTMQYDLDNQDYLVDTSMANTEDPNLHKENGQICVKWPNGTTGDCVKAGEENFIVEPTDNSGQGTGTIWTKQASCWWAYQLWVHNDPIEVDLLMVDDVNGESTIWCSDGEVKLVEKGESASHNGQTVEITAEGQVLIDGEVKVTSGVSTCALVIEAKSGAMHRIERFTELSPGSRQGLLHPSVLLLGPDAGWEDLNRGSAVGMWKELADRVCPPPVQDTPTSTATPSPTSTPSPTASPTASNTATASPTGTAVPPTATATNTAVPPTASPMPTLTPTSTQTPVVDTNGCNGDMNHGVCLPLILHQEPAPFTCPLQFGFGTSQPTDWYNFGETYPTQSPGANIWLRLKPGHGYVGTLILGGEFKPAGGGNTIVITEQYHNVNATVLWYQNAQPGRFALTFTNRTYNPTLDTVVCSGEIKIDDDDPNLP